MTPQQADWLRQNKPYRALHPAPGGFRFVKKGILHGDGTFELREQGKSPRITQGCFEVGVLEEIKPQPR